MIRIRTVSLSALFVAGLYFWVPPLYWALIDQPSRVVSIDPPSLNIHAPTVIAETSFTPKTSRAQNFEPGPMTDPLVRSAEAAAIGSQPLQIDRNQVPPPILFADAQSQASLTAHNDSDRPASRADEKTGHGLMLESTIIGVRRRAAYINHKLYVEGARIDVNGKTYALMAVYPRKAMLRRGNHVIELNVPSPRAEN